MEPVAPLDSSIVERYAEHLDRRASARVMSYTIVFALLGAILGSVPLLAPNRVLIPHYLGLGLLLVGAAAGGYLGYTLGVRRAEGLRLQAQVTLHQLQVEHLLIQPQRPATRVAPAPVLAAPAPAAPAPPAPAPVAAPVTPAPVAPAPVAPAPAAPTFVPAAAPVAPAPVVVTPPPAPLAPPVARPAMPPLSAPATSDHQSVVQPPAATAPAPVQPSAVAAPPLAVAPPVPIAPRLVQAPPAGPPAMMPPLSAER